MLLNFARAPLTPRGRGTFPNKLLQRAPDFATASLPHPRTSLQHPFISRAFSLPLSSTSIVAPVNSRPEGEEVGSSPLSVTDSQQQWPSSPFAPPPIPEPGLAAEAAKGTSQLKSQQDSASFPLSSRALNRINEREHSKHSKRFQNRQPATSFQAAILD